MDRESIYGTESVYDEVKPGMKRLAVKVAKAIYEGEWQTELVTREIATAANRAEALARLETLRQEIDRAEQIISRGGKP